MTTLLAALPLLVVLTAMLARRWGAQQAGPAGWIAGVGVGLLAFGLTPEVWWVSQAKGLLLSASVLAVLWTALLLYGLVDQAGGIHAVAAALERAVGDRGALAILLAWAFGGMLEGVAGFGLPIAIVAPMLTRIGVTPVRAVAAVAAGHAWAVTFGDMGIIWQTLITVVGIDGRDLAPHASMVLGIACLLCGFVAAAILGQARRVGYVLAIGVLMAATQYAIVAIGVPALGAFGAGTAGLVGGVALAGARAPAGAWSPALRATLVIYAALVVLMTAVTLEGPLRQMLNRVVWQANFPAVTTTLGVETPAGSGQVFHPLTHPATVILLVACLGAVALARRGLLRRGGWRAAVAGTWRAAAPASLGVVFLVGLAVLMDHCGMTLHLARAAVGSFGVAYPLVSPSVGMLGAFATGSNNSSNVLLGVLQRDAATLLGLAPSLLVAAQTAGGALGSMIAPAKLGVGCATMAITGREGEVLRITLPYGLALGAVLGVLVALRG